MNQPKNIITNQYICMYMRKNKTTKLKKNLYISNLIFINTFSSDATNIY